MARCNMDCFSCPLPDCTNNTLTTADRLESKSRDLLFGEPVQILQCRGKNHKEKAKKDYRHRGIENLVIHREEKRNETNMQ